jgi:hypothetical protein
VNERFLYEYAFTDGWEHQVRMERFIPPGATLSGYSTGPGWLFAFKLITSPDVIEHGRRQWLLQCEQS